MKVSELWAMTTYGGKVQIEDAKELNSISNPIVRFEEGISDMVYNEENEYHYLADKEVKYFDFMFNTLRIILKETKNEKDSI